MENKFIELVFHDQNPEIDLPTRFALYPQVALWARFDKKTTGADAAKHYLIKQTQTHRENEFKEKRVQWTRFPYMETEFIELGFCATLPSSLNSISVPRQFSRKSSPLDSNVINEISLKLCLTYNIEWVLWLF